jgi:hypothetical protein
MAVRRVKRRASRPTRRRVKRGRGWDDFVAGFTAPIMATVDAIQGNYGSAAKRFTDLGPRLAQGFNGRGMRRGVPRARMMQRRILL